MTKDFIDDLFEVVEVKKTVQKSSKERFQVNKVNSFEIGGIEVVLKRQLSEDTKKKISETKKKVKRVTSEETRKKLSEASKGKTHTLEARKKISEANKGHVVTEETRKKLSEAHKGRKVSEEVRRQMSKDRKGRSLTEETKRKISASNKGRKRTEEQCKYLSDIRRLPIMTPNGEFISRRFLIQKLTDEGMKAAANKLTLWFKLYPNHYYYIGDKSAINGNFNRSPNVEELVKKLLQIITDYYRSGKPLTVVNAISLKTVASKSTIQNLLDYMVEVGLIEKKLIGMDLRKKYVIPTKSSIDYVKSNKNSKKELEHPQNRLRIQT
jgi:hypothetical protein